MARHHTSPAAEVLNHEVAATRRFLERIQRLVSHLQRRAAAALRLGTEADAAIKAAPKQVMHDIYYPNVTALRHG
ncbi:MAG: hypothetical protein AB8B58_17235 [Roseobacter sp.]